MQFIVGMLCSVILLMLRALVIMKLWAWFIVAQFVMLPHLNYGVAMGISLLAGSLTTLQYYPLRLIEDIQQESTEETYKVMFFNTGIHVLGLLMSLGMGWVIHSFM